MPIALATGTVLVLVVIVVLPIAAFSFMGAGKALAQIGKGPLSIEPEPVARRGAPPSPVSREVREEEIRQMVQASSDRRASRGEAPLDVEAEVARLAEEPKPAAEYDPGLRDEVRQMVQASSDRRVARGEAPLDIEAEVERRLRELS